MTPPWWGIPVVVVVGLAGGFIAGNDIKYIKKTIGALPSILKGSKFTKALYIDLLAMLFEILAKVRKEGLMSIEKDVEDPHSSPLFQKYPTVGNDHHVTEFITDYLRMMVSGNLNAHEIESLMDSEIETHHQEAHAPVAALARLAGALPAFGIVAAVLGVVACRFLKLPPMLGYLVVGVLIGPHTLAFAQDSAAVKYLAEFGVVFLMFSIGLEFSLAKLYSMKRIVFGLGLLQVAVSMLLIAGLVLFVLTFLVNAVARIVIQRRAAFSE